MYVLNVKNSSGETVLPSGIDQFLIRFFKAVSHCIMENIPFDKGPSGLTVEKKGKLENSGDFPAVYPPLIEIEGKSQLSQRLVMTFPVKKMTPLPL